MNTEEKRIFILDNRFVYVGYGNKVKDYMLGDCVEITDCYNVRYYGTNKGLSQLAYQGKQEGTTLDYCPPLRVPISRIVATIKVEDKIKDTLC
jgi:hypothetical protein